MAAQGFLLIASFLLVLLVLARPLGSLLARMINDVPLPGLAGVERGIWRLAGIRRQEMDWRQYLIAIVLFNAIGLAALMALLMCRVAAVQSAALPQPVMGFSVEYRGQFRQQHQLAGLRRGNHHELSQPDGGPGGAKLPVGRDRYCGDLRADPRLGATESQHPRQRLGRPDPHYAVAATASFSADRAVLCATGRAAEPAGLSAVHQPEGVRQWLPMGPVASQEAIKMLGTNGGGFFNANSSHPFENPTALTNRCRCWRSS